MTTPAYQRPSTADHPTEQSEVLRVALWRRARLIDAGLPSDMADRLAAAADVDLHAVLDLLARGCPPHLTERILAPVG